MRRGGATNVLTSRVTKKYVYQTFKRWGGSAIINSVLKGWGLTIREDRNKKSAEWKGGVHGGWGEIE